MLEGDLEFKTELQASLHLLRQRESLRQARFLAVPTEPLTPDDPWQYWRHKGLSRLWRFC